MDSELSTHVSPPVIVEHEERGGPFTYLSSSLIIKVTAKASSRLPIMRIKQRVALEIVHGSTGPS
jgi:hypothetical protein